MRARRLAANVARGTGILRLGEFVSRHVELRDGKLRSCSPKIAILCYHRIGTGGIPFYTELPTRVFEAQMRYVSSHYKVVPLGDVPRLLKSGELKEPAVVVTFDDGYIGTYTEAFPILQKYNIPATTYLTADCIETGRPAWYDRNFLALQVCEQSTFTIEIAGTTCTYELKSAALRLQAGHDINRRLRRLPDEERVAVVAEIERRNPLPIDAMNGRMLDWNLVRKMQDGGHYFGCHTMTHPTVSRLNPRQYDYELVQSKQLIEARIGRPAPDFAFPFGLEADMAAVPELLGNMGYKTATTMNYGVNEAAADMFRLYRFPTTEDPINLMAVKLALLFWTGESQKASSPIMLSAERPKGVSA